MRRLLQRRSFDDRGAVMAEFALALPILAVLALGMFEYGFAWRQTAIVDSAASASGRTAASLGNYALTDYEALRAVDSALASGTNITVERVVIYRSTTANGAVPAACAALNPTGAGQFGIAGVCNVYSAQQVANPSLVGFPRGSLSNPQCLPGSWDGRWCPVGRRSERPNPDYVGVDIRVEYESLTNLIPGTDFTITRTAVFLLEPPAIGT